jgi:hypothetical protein
VYLLFLFGEILDIFTEFGKLILEFFLFELLNLSDFGEFGIGDRKVGRINFSVKY